MTTKQHYAISVYKPHLSGDISRGECDDHTGLDDSSLHTSWEGENKEISPALFICIQSATPAKSKMLMSHGVERYGVTANAYKPKIFSVPDYLRKLTEKRRLPSLHQGRSLQEIQLELRWVIQLWNPFDKQIDMHKPMTGDKRINANYHKI